MGAGTQAYGKMTLLLVSGALLVLSALYFTVPIIATISEEFAVTPGKAALAGAVFSICFALGCLVYGPLSSRLGRKRVMVAGLIGLSLATLLTCLVGQFHWLLILRGLQGATASTFSPVALTYAGEMFPADRRVTVIGFISTGFLLSGIVGQVLASALTYWSGWQAVFLLFGIFYGVLAACFLLWLPEAPRARKQALHLGASLAAIAKNRSLLCCYIITVTVLLSFVGAYSALAFYLTEPPFSLSFMQIVAIRAAGIVGMALCLFAGRLCRRFGMAAIIRAGLLLAIIGLLLLGMVQTVVMYTLASVVFVAGIALIVPSLIAIIGELGGTSRALATSLYTFILFIGASLGPVLAMQVLEWRLTVTVFHLLAVVLIISLLASTLIKQPAISGQEN